MKYFKGIVWIIFGLGMSNWRRNAFCYNNTNNPKNLKNNKLFNNFNKMKNYIYRINFIDKSLIKIYEILNPSKKRGNC